jgi:hypothetical protein
MPLQTLQSILLTRASGFINGRLLIALDEKGLKLENPQGRAEFIRPVLIP